MIRHSSCSCTIKSSKLGAKGFYYPNNELSGLRIKKGTQFEILHFVAGHEFSEWQAILVENNQVEGSPISDGKGVYWILRKNVN